jgi:WD40 repeat protein
MFSNSLRSYLQPRFAFFWADDIFISYSRADGTNYAEGLASQLAKRGFSCRVDLWETSPGVELPATLRRALRSSKMFVLIGTEGAAGSPNVDLEVDEFLNTKRTIIPIYFGRMIDNALWLPKLRGLPFTGEVDHDALITGDPSDEVMSRIENSAKFTRRNRRLRRAFVSSLLIFAVLIALNAVAAVQTRTAFANVTAARAEAVQANQEADRARASAGEATRASKQAKAEAEKATQAAEQATIEAKKQSQLAETANAQRSLAEGKTRVAQDLERRARANAAEQEQIASSRRLAGQATSFFEDQLDLALLLSLESRQVRDTVESRGTLLTGLEYSPQIRAFLGGNADQVISLALSPDGRLVASGGYDGTVIIWDLGSYQTVAQYSNSDTPVACLAFSPDSQTLVSNNWDGTTTSWDRESRGAIKWPTAQKLEEFLFSPDGRTLVSVSGNTVMLWDAANKKPIGNPLSGHEKRATSVAVSANGKVLASADEGGAIILWDRDSLKRIGQPLVGHQKRVTSLTFSPDGKTLVSTGWDDEINVWGIPGGNLRTELSEPNTHLLTAAVSPDCKTLAVSTEDNHILLWDMDSRRYLGKPLIGHKADVRSITFSPDSKTLASGSRNGTVILWNVIKRPNQSRTPKGNLTRVAFSPDGRIVATSSDDKTITLLDAAGRQPLDQLVTDHKTAIRSLAYSPDGKTFASGGDEGSIILWDAATRRPAGAPMKGHDSPVFDLAFTPDAKTLASGNQDGTIIFWDVAGRQRIGEPLRHPDDVVSISFSPDGKMLAAASEDGTVIAWDVAGRKAVNQIFIKETDDIVTLAFSPDGKTVAVASGTGAIILWDVTSRKPPAGPLLAPRAEAISVAFNSDGNVLAAGSSNRIILWDVATRQRIGQFLLSESDFVTSMAFSPNGETLVSGSWEGATDFWDVSTESWQRRACRVANRNLTCEEWNQLMGSRPYHQTCPGLTGPKTCP